MLIRTVACLWQSARPVNGLLLEGNMLLAFHPSMDNTSCMGSMHVVRVWPLPVHWLGVPVLLLTLTPATGGNTDSDGNKAKRQDLIRLEMINDMMYAADDFFGEARYLFYADQPVTPPPVPAPAVAKAAEETKTPAPVDTSAAVASSTPITAPPTPDTGSGGGPGSGTGEVSGGGTPPTPGGDTGGGRALPPDIGGGGDPGGGGCPT
jgi:hypothetical protein